MKLQTKQWFLITSRAMLPSYSKEDLNLLWNSFSTAQLDFIKDMFQTSYNAGYKAAEEDR